MIRAPEMRSPAPRANAGNRAEVACNEPFYHRPAQIGSPFYGDLSRPALWRRLAAGASHRRPVRFREGSRMKDAPDFEALTQATLVAFPERGGM